MNSRKIQNLFILVSILTLLISCKEEVLTPGEVTGKKIKSLQKEKEISLCYVYVNEALAENNQTFKVEGQFLILGSVKPRYYDLNNLISFSATETGTDQYFNFYFE